MHNILAVNNKIPIHCKTVLLTGQQFVNLLSANEGLIFIGSSQCKDVSWFSDLKDEDIENI